VNWRIATLYQTIGIITILYIQSSKVTTQFYIGPITTPPINLLFLGMLSIWLILNLNQLIKDKLNREEVQKKH
jgi:hypothetical protein